MFRSHALSEVFHELRSAAYSPKRTQLAEGLYLSGCSHNHKDTLLTVHYIMVQLFPYGIDINMIPAPLRLKGSLPQKRQPVFFRVQQISGGKDILTV